MEISRDLYLNKLILRKNNGFIKIITGIRRCGKSYLLNTIFYKHLLQSGVDSNHIIRFAFDDSDDLKLLGIHIDDINQEKYKVPPSIFMDFISKKINDHEQFYILLDEVQKLENFELVLNTYLRKHNLDIYVTGSNSKFLSSDIITEFRGRGDEIHVFPLSFSEFINVYQGSKDEAFNEYSIYGGLPACALMTTDEQKTSYLKTQMENVYLRDIIERYNLKDDNLISELTDIIASGISCLTNPLKLSNTFKTIKKENNIAPYTIDKYIKYLAESYIISKAIRYDIKRKKYIETPFKIYFEDIGLRNARIEFRQIEQTHIMENIIFNELRYRGFDVDVGVVEIRKMNQNKQIRAQYEIDFIANLGSKRFYIQSAYEIPNQEKWKQETKSFDKIKDSFKKIVIVKDTKKATYDENGYMIIGIKEFLLDPNILY
ncbi:MAG: ATP-binding protein [Alphaproteobacteria bacterium]|nr:ATP-binding protein [Alphaproteobacteria bacterium]